MKSQSCPVKSPGCAETVRARAGAPRAAPTTGRGAVRREARSRGGLAAGRPGRGGRAGDDAVPGIAQGVELVVGEVLQEERAYAGEVCGAGAGEHVDAGLGEDGVGAAGVARARLAPDQALALEAVGQSREPGAAEDDRRGEVPHAQAPLGGVVEV